MQNAELENRIGDPETEDNAKKRKISGPYTWVIMGICVSLLAACIFTAFYGVFRRNAEKFKTTPVETENGITFLYQYSYLLYKDLYNKINQTNLSYSELYIQPTEGNEWINNQEIFERVRQGDYSAIPGGTDVSQSSDGTSPEESLETVWSDLESDVYQIQHSREYLENHFSELEQAFAQFNLNYDYLAEDLTTGETLTNLSSTEISTDSMYFNLSFQFDEKGNVSMGSDVKGNDPTRIRKYANEVMRNCSLNNLVSNSFGREVDSSVFEFDMPRNFRITFCINALDWQQMEEKGYFISAISDYNYDAWTYFEAYRFSGCSNFYLLCLLAVFLAAVFLPYAGKGKPWNLKACRLPLEGVILLGCIPISLGGDAIIELVRGVATKSYATGFAKVISSQVLAQALVYLLNIIALTVLFFSVWYLGICIRAVRDLKIKEYLQERCIFYRIFPFLKVKILEIYKAVSHFDVTKNAHKLILKIVLLNGVILFIISSLWVGGFMAAIIYSIVLYFVLRKYISDIQKKYSLLLGYINKIAEGNLNGNMTEDLGVFDPFKPQLIRIQRGFKKAVEEEVKSQKMKSELITNVSHDLKTPLTAIITYVDLLKNEDLTPEQRREYLDTLERKSLRLKVLIEDLFEVSKASTGNVTLNIVNVDIMNLVKQVVFELSDKLKAANLDVRVHLTDERVILPLDSQKTYRIYENLVGNIVKYALPGTRVYINGFRIDDTVVITLKNISAQEINVEASDLTERFKRGDTSRNTEGSGLGLAIAKSFTELQNGKLDLEVDGDLFKVTTTWKLDTETAH